jgi:hypothetical protein
MKWIRHCYKIPHENIFKNKLHAILRDWGEKREFYIQKEEEKIILQKIIYLYTPFDNFDRIPLLFFTF